MAYHIFVKRGDAADEVDSLARELGGAARAGLHKYLVVARAEQTVVMLDGAETPLAHALRGRAGWVEPATGAEPG